MAKGARASTKRSNRTALRAKVFKPVEDARAIRLNAKLQELIAQPLPEREEMDLDTGAICDTSHTESSIRVTLF